MTSKVFPIIVGIFVPVISIFAAIAVPEIRCFSGLDKSQCPKTELISLKDVDIKVETDSYQPVSEAEVEFSATGAPETILTDSRGYAKIRIPSTTDIRITLRKEGFDTKSYVIDLRKETATTRTFRLFSTLKSSIEVPPKPSPDLVKSQESMGLKSPDSTQKSGVISGQWIGKYACSQGVTGVTVTINQAGSSLMADFSLYALPENPNVPSGLGVYHRGVFDPNVLSMSFPDGEWVRKPASGWVAYGFDGQFDDNLKTFIGKVKGYRCTTIRLSKKED